MKKNKIVITNDRALAECILEKIFCCENSNKEPNYIILDKKTFKILKNATTIFMPSISISTKMFGIKIKIVKSKEQIICVGY